MAMTYWYRIKPYSIKIEAIQVVKSSDHFLTLALSKFKEAKHCKYADYFETFDAAKTHLLGRIQADINYHTAKTHVLENDLQCVKSAHEESK